VNPNDAEPVLTEWGTPLFNPLEAGNIYFLGISPDGRQMLLSDPRNKPAIAILDLTTGDFSWSFGTAFATRRRINRVWWLP
jgi:hypothetical protein